MCVIVWKWSQAAYIDLLPNKWLLFFFYFIFLTLKYCIGFAIYQHESATDIHVFPILNPPPSCLPYHPFGSSQCNSPKHPVSCIEPGLVTHFIHDILHVFWISSNEMDETGAYYTEWSKPERKTPIQYTNAYIWNLERW